MKLARALGIVCLAAMVPWIGCSQTPATVTIRSLERSGKVAFVCVDLNPKSSTPTLPTNHCHPLPTTLDKADRRVPHMIALVTQTTRGEVAVVDITAGTVLDVDPSTPGFGFIPVGTAPTDIVATTGGTASFVSVADPNRPGIFALPTTQVLPADLIPSHVERSGAAVPKLTSFPACALPSAPGAMVIIPDRSKAAHCPGAPLAEAGAEPELAAGRDLSNEASVYGTAKLVVTLPELGQIAVIDAQALLARPLGSFDACPIEDIRQLTYDPADTAAADAGAAPAGDASCPGPPKSAAPPPVAPPKAHPAQLAYSDDGRLFISDDQAPVIHVLDATSPCALRETAPLLAVSADDPGRSVVSDALAVTPLTRDEKRYVYAVDLKQGSLMVFDVSAGSTTRTPLPRPDAEYTPFEPSDRIAFQAPVHSLTFARHDNPIPVPPATSPTGVASESTCEPTDPANPYRASSDFSGGAGPRNLRGIFGFISLADGTIGVVDIDDLDAACRRPQTTDSPLLGCEGKVPTDATHPPFPAATGEASCKVFERHRKRSSPFVINADLAGRHAPSMQTPPLLRDKEGTVLAITGEGINHPKLLGPLIVGGLAGDTEDPVVKQYISTVSGASVDLVSLSPCAYAAGCPGPGGEAPASDAGASNADAGAQDGGGAVADAGAAPAVEAGAAADGGQSSGVQYAPSTTNWVAFDLKEPRAHHEQGWAITYEGALPGFAGHYGGFECDGDGGSCAGVAEPKELVFRDGSASFCGRGVEDAALARSKMDAGGDWFSITDALPVPEDPYWAGVEATCTQVACQAAFGTPENPRALGRDYEILEAYQDRLLLKPKRIEYPGDPTNTKTLPLTCCFPYLVQYAIRANNHWTVQGTLTGFEHRVVTDPASTDSSTARCVESCDPRLTLRNGRARMLESGEPVPKWDDPRLFRSSTMRFAVWAPLPTTPSCADCLLRDMFFSFTEVGGFASLFIPASSTALVSPQTIRFVPGLEQLALSDAISQGLILVDLGRLTAVQSFF